MFDRLSKRAKGIMLLLCYNRSYEMSTMGVQISNSINKPMFDDKRITDMESGKFYLDGQVEQGVLLLRVHYCIANLIFEVVVGRLECEVVNHPYPYELVYNGEVH